MSLTFQLVGLLFLGRAEKLLAAYAPRFYSTGVTELNNTSRHWKFLLGAAVITVIVFIYTLRYHSSWPLIIWVILVACLFAATFPAWRNKK
jgi:hypothetical protein